MHISESGSGQFTVVSLAATAVGESRERARAVPDLKDVKGHESAKRALEITVARVELI